MRRDGAALNARRVKLPGKPGVPKERLEAFRAVLEERVALLDAHAVPGPHLAGTAGETEHTPGGES